MCIPSRTHPPFRRLAGILAVLGAAASPAADPPPAPSGEKRAGGPPRPNVLFIAIDDLRDWTGFLGCTQARTPHLDRLASRGVSFTRAYCAAPVCNPSRVALLTGLRPSSTGVYDNATDWRPSLAEVVTLPQHFKRHGYFVSGAGKIYHGNFPQGSDWDEFHNRARPRPGPEGKRRTAAPVPGLSGGAGGISFAALDGDDDAMEDWWTVEHTLEVLRRPHDRPFFIACGLVKPHLPWNVPRKYFDLFPLDRVKLPEVKEGDLGDVPPEGVRMAGPEGDHAAIVRAGLWKDEVRAYLAAIAFTDAMVGRLLAGLEESPHASNTIVCLWSDHGWQLGEKEHWRKFALWEESARAPLIMVVPGLTRPAPCHRTVDFMCIYPTLCDLCGIPVPPHVEGTSIRGLLADPTAAWDRPAITTYLRGNHSVRTERWRYIRYAGGGEELYDHGKDPLEWTNLAGSEESAETRKGLRAFLPSRDAPVAKGRERPAVEKSAAEKRAARKARAAAKAKGD